MRDNIVVVGHQPQYLPYLGILNKISKADIFIMVDHVQFVKKYFHNRSYIKVNELPVLLTIPVLTKGKFKAPISEIEINYDINWVRKHLRSMQLGYSKAKYFNSYYGDIEGIYLNKYNKLSDLTSALLTYFIREFELVEDIRYSSTMNITGSKTEMLIQLAHAVDGATYLSGKGARDYVDEDLLSGSDVKHEFCDFTHPQYPQLGSGFLEGMGCVDLLFNCGKDGRKCVL